MLVTRINNRLVGQELEMNRCAGRNIESSKEANGGSLFQGKTGLLVAVAFVIALALRLGYVLTLQTDEIEWADERAFVTIAINYQAGYGFVHHTDDADLSSDVMRRRASKAPGYPFFLAIFSPPEMKLYGSDIEPLSEESKVELKRFLVSVRIAQAFLGAFVCVLAWLIARRLFSDTVGVIAAFILSIYPFHIYYCGVMFSEMLFTPIFMVSILLIDVAAKWERPGGAHPIFIAAAAGSLFGISALVRSSALLYPLFYLPFLFVSGMKFHADSFSKSISLSFRPLMVFLVAFLAFAFTMMPWTVRNYLLFEEFVPTTLQTGESFYEANSSYATGGPGWHLVDWEKESGGRLMDEYENDRFWHRKGVEWIKENPDDFIRLAFVKFGRTWNVIPNYEGVQSPFYIAVSLLSYLPVMLLGLGGLWLSRKKLRRLLVIIAPVLYYTLMHMVFVGSIRYRAPVIPFVIMFTALAVLRILENFNCPAETREKS